MTIEEMLAQYLAAQLEVKKAEPKPEVEQFVTPAQLQTVLSGFAEQVSKAVAEAVATQVAEQVEKALPVTREQGAGRVGTENAEDPRESDPVAYLVAKSQSEGGLSDEDKRLAWALTKAVITDGMRD